MLKHQGLFSLARLCDPRRQIFTSIMIKHSTETTALHGYKFTAVNSRLILKLQIGNISEPFLLWKVAMFTGHLTGIDFMSHVV